jgi:trimethylamine:corrinoid methyltransferase-like protein
MDIWPKIVEAYVPPPMDPARVEEMQAYIAHRREEIGSGDA